MPPSIGNKVIALAFGLLMASTAAAQSTVPAASIKSSLQSRLTSQGYVTLEGTTAVAGIDECDRFIAVFGNCFGNNPAAPYIVLTSPYWDDEFVDPQYGAVVTLDGANFGPHRMRADEATVVLGKTGPLAAYTGLQSYVFTRKGEPGGNLFAALLNAVSPDTKDIFFMTSPNPDRYMSFASLGDSVNNAKIAKSVGASSGFDQDIAVISTADRDLAEFLRQNIISLGIPANRVFIESLPDSVRLGSGEGADDLLTLIRYALPKDAVAGDAWRNGSPFKVLRVRKSQPKLLVRRYGAPVVTAKVGTSEATYQTALDQLTALVRSTLRVPVDAAEAALTSSELFKLNGPDCLKHSMNCLGDSQDTDSYRLSQSSVLGHRDVFIVTGVNHAETGNATYVSLALNYTEILKGVESASQTGTAAGFVTGSLKGSAEALVALSPTAPPSELAAKKGQLYVQLFARDCTGLPVCIQVSEASMPLAGTGLVIQRAYLRPGNTVGADPGSMVTPKMVIWKR